MFNFTFWFVTIIALILVAIVLTQVIMKPIKDRREVRRWNTWKKEYATGMR